MSEHFKVDWLRCGPMSERSLFAAPGRVCGGKLNCYWFHWIYQGKCICRVKGKKYQLGPDDIVLLQPGHTPQWEADPIEPTLAHYFGFSTPEIPADWPARQRWPVVRRMPENDVIRPLFEYVSGCGPDDSTAAGMPPAIEAAIEVMVTAFVRGPMERMHTFPRIYPPSVQRTLVWIQDLMNSEPGRKVTLDDLAGIGGVSRTHMCRLFSQYVGYPPLEVLYIYRLTRSLSALNTGKKIESIAFDFGFTNAGHYTHRFSIMFGKSPSEMRKAMAKGYKPKLPHLPTMG